MNAKLFPGAGKSEVCLHVKESRVLAGSTLQLFEVKYNPNCLDTTLLSTSKLAFIIKVLKPQAAQKEFSNLNLVYSYPPLRTMGKLKDSSLPQLIFNENFYYYDVPGQPGKGAFSLLHPAKGEDFNSILLDKQKNHSHAEKKQAFRKLGEVLANFQKRFMKGKNCLLLGGTKLDACSTLVHGDFHKGNIFYDNHFIYWIDLESMADSIEENESPIEDPIAFGSSIKLFSSHAWEKFKPLYDMFLESYLEHLTKDISIRDKVREKIISEQEESDDSTGSETEESESEDDDY